MIEAFDEWSQRIALRILLPVAVTGTNSVRRGKEENRLPAYVRKPSVGCQTAPLHQEADRASCVYGKMEKGENYERST